MQIIFMKNVNLEGVHVLNMEEQEQVTGGIGLVLLACLGGLYTCYNIGKAVGEEAYHLSN